MSQHEEQSPHSGQSSGQASGTARSEVMPTVGRTVHYFTRDDAAPQAAIVTAVNPDSPGYVSLHVFTTRGTIGAGLRGPRPRRRRLYRQCAPRISRAADGLA